MHHTTAAASHIVPLRTAKVTALRTTILIVALRVLAMPYPLPAVTTHNASMRNVTPIYPPPTSACPTGATIPTSNSYFSPSRGAKTANGRRIRGPSRTGRSGQADCPLMTTMRSTVDRRLPSAFREKPLPASKAPADQVCSPSTGHGLSIPFSPFSRCFRRKGHAASVFISGITGQDGRDSADCRYGQPVAGAAGSAATPSLPGRC